MVAIDLSPGSNDTIAARISSAFEHAIGMENDRARMVHHFFKRAGHLHLVTRIGQHLGGPRRYYRLRPSRSHEGTSQQWLLLSRLSPRSHCRRR